MQKGSSDTIKDAWEKLNKDKDPYMLRSEDYSRMTLPQILPTDSSHVSDAIGQYGFDSTGAEAVNHLANKLVMILFPPQKSFFRAEPSEQVKESMLRTGLTETDLAKHFIKIEKSAMSAMEKSNSRIVLIEVMKQLIVTGNVLLHFMPDGQLAAIGLRRYSLQRDSSGKLIHLIIRRERRFGTFSDELKSKIKSSKGNNNIKDDEKITIFTQAKFKKGKFHIKQAVDDIDIGKTSVVRPSKLPWLPLMWNSAYEEDYGRGHVEDYAGAFSMLEFLNEAKAKGMILMSDIKYLIKPGGVTDIDHLASSPTGEFVFGNIDDVGVLQLEKYANFEPIINVIQDYEKQIGRAFLLHLANRRDAERVTAYELRLDANELETSLGGVYSQFAQTLQKPYAYHLISRISTKLGQHNITPVITTGIEALGKIGELDKVQQFSELMKIPREWSEQAQARIKWGDYIQMVANYLSMEIPWLKSEEQYNKELKQAQAAATQVKMEEAAIDTTANIAVNESK